MQDRRRRGRKDRRWRRSSFPGWSGTGTPAKARNGKATPTPSFFSARTPRRRLGDALENQVNTIDDDMLDVQEMSQNE